jgi:hypothetical protein
VITIRNTERYEDKKQIKVGNKIIKKWRKS